MGFAETVEAIKKKEEHLNHQEKNIVEERGKQLDATREKQKQLTKELEDTLASEKDKALAWSDQYRKEMIAQSTISAQEKIQKLRVENEDKEKEVIAFIISKIFE
ncbi:MAG: hypothetical protein ACRCWY_06005 [Cellulosilyticaceae bacterium]